MPGGGALLIDEIVKWTSLGDLLDYTQPTKYIVSSTEYSDEYDVPVLTAGQTFILGYTNETENIYNATKDNAVIVFDDFTTATKWVDFPFKVKSSAMKILTAKDGVNLRYVNYAMQCIKYDTVEHSRQWISKYSELQIAMPPVEVQQWIVEVLDKFDKLVNDLTEGLPAEIEARRKQYKYYRDTLLNFKEIDIEE